MAWCPKCKNEYRAGIAVCAECGCELVEQNPSETGIPLIFGEKEQMELLADFLKSNKIMGTKIRYAEEEQVYELLVKEEDQQRAAKIARIFLEQEALRVMEEEDAAQEIQHTSGEEASGDLQEPVRTLPYQSSEEAAEDNRSSAWTLLIVGVAGVVVMILGILEMLPFHVGNPYMFYGVLSAVFLLFVVMGVVSMKNARIFEKKAASESSLKDALLTWCTENLKQQEIDAQIENAAGLAPEIIYFRRTEQIKEKLNHQFVNLDQAFLDRLIDEVVYEMIFPEKMQ